MLEKYKGIIFDLDGTLVNSMWVWEQIDIDFLKNHGVDGSVDFQEEIEGMSFTETSVYFKERFGIKASVEEIIQELVERAMDSYKNKVKIKENVVELLTYFSERNIPMGVGTSNSRELAQATLEGNNILKYFKTLNTSCEVNKGKPSPDIFLKVASVLGIEPKDCLVFEDTMAGVQAAKAAGMDVIAIYDEVTTISVERMKSEANQFIYNYSEILSN